MVELDLNIDIKKSENENGWLKYFSLFILTEKDKEKLTFQENKASPILSNVSYTAETGRISGTLHHEHFWSK